MGPLTPMQVEARLISLDRDLEDSFAELEEAEYEYHTLKGEYEIGMAGARMALIETGKMTVSEKDDRALLANQERYQALMIAEARAKAARANVMKLRAQADIVRSMGASLRSAQELA